MSRELQPWGGDVRLPGWVRRLLRRPSAPDTPERVHEARQPQDPGVTVAEHVTGAHTHHSQLPQPDRKRRPKP